MHRWLVIKMLSVRFQWNWNTILNVTDHSRQKTPWISWLHKESPASFSVCSYCVLVGREVVDINKNIIFVLFHDTEFLKDRQTSISGTSPSSFLTHIAPKAANAHPTTHSRNPVISLIHSFLSSAPLSVSDWWVLFFSSSLEIRDCFSPEFSPFPISHKFVI